MSGTSRSLLALVLFAVGIGSLGWVQASGVVGVARDAARWVGMGAAVQIVSFPGAVDAAQCEALVSLEGINAAGAIRQGSNLRLAVLPSRELESFEVTPGMSGILHPSVSPQPTGFGLWLSHDLASQVGVTPGDTLVLRGSTQPADVGGVFWYPVADGRNPILAYSILEVVPPVGVFDACWVEVWPERAQSEALAIIVGNPMPVDHRGQRPTPQIERLNTTFGIVFNAKGRLDRLPTTQLMAAAVIYGMALGWGLIRMRRLELASALHAGLSKISLTLQTTLEAVTWVIAAIVLLWPVQWWVASHNNPDTPWPALFPAIQTVTLAGIAVLLGTIIATLATREKHLFRLFKNR